MTFSSLLKEYGVSVAAILVLIGGTWWGVDQILSWHAMAQGTYAEMHEFIHPSDDLPFQDGQLTDAQIAARDNATTAVETPKDALDWAVLAAGKLNFKKQGNDQIPEPVYTPRILALDGKTVKAAGYIFPLDQSGKQMHFLLSPYPPSCPYCLPAGPNELIEVKTVKPIPFTYDTITVKGVFDVLRDERIKQGMLYAMHDAVLQ